MGTRHGIGAGIWVVALLTTIGAGAQNVQVSLNLRYADPADPSEGGTWQLVAKTDDPDGIAAVNTYMRFISTTGIAYGPNIGAMTNAGLPFVVPGDPANVFYFQNTAAAGVVVGVGTGAGSPGNQPLDPLGDAAWNDAALIATGSFPSDRPVFAPKNGNHTDANTLPSSTPPFNNAQDAVTTTVVRGAALASLGLDGGGGLLRGDANQDRVVNAVDLNRVLLNFLGNGKTWDEGDVTDGLGGHVEGVVDAADLNQVLLNFNKTSLPPAGTPAIAAAPEPTAALLLVVGAVTSALRRRRRSR